MRTAVIILLLHCVTVLVAAEEAATKDLDIEDNEDLERSRHRKRKKHGQNQNGGCGYGRSFGEKFFGLQDYTYVSAPVMNYFFGCGIAAVPVAAAPIAPVAPIAPIAPIQPYPAYSIAVSQSQSGGHHQHGHHGHHGNGGFGGGYGGNFNPGYNQGYNQGFNQGYNPGLNQNIQRPGYGYPQNRPFQGAVSAAASGFGNALADYISRPKTQKYINRQVNQFLKPFYKLF